MVPLKSKYLRSLPFCLVLSFAVVGIANGVLVTFFSAGLLAGLALVRNTVFALSVALVLRVFLSLIRHAVVVAMQADGGGFLLSVASYLNRHDDRVVSSTIADIQWEIAEAKNQGQYRRAQWVALTGICILLKTAIIRKFYSLTDQIRKLVG